QHRGGEQPRPSGAPTAPIDPGGRTMTDRLTTLMPEVGDLLDRWAEESATDPGLDVPSYLVAPSPGGRGSRRPAVLVGAAALVALIAAVGGVLSRAAPE